MWSKVWIEVQGLFAYGYLIVLAQFVERSFLLYSIVVVPSLKISFPCAGPTFQLGLLCSPTSMYTCVHFRTFYSVPVACLSVFAPIPHCWHVIFSSAVDSGSGSIARRLDSSVLSLTWPEIYFLIPFFTPRHLLGSTYIRIPAGLPTKPRQHPGAARAKAAACRERPPSLSSQHLK